MLYVSRFAANILLAVASGFAGLKWCIDWIGRTTVTEDTLSLIEKSHWIIQSVNSSPWIAVVLLFLTNSIALIYLNFPKSGYQVLSISEAKKSGIKIPTLEIEETECAQETRLLLAYDTINPQPIMKENHNVRLYYSYTHQNLQFVNQNGQIIVVDPGTTIWIDYEKADRNGNARVVSTPTQRYSFIFKDTRCAIVHFEKSLQDVSIEFHTY